MKTKLLPLRRRCAGFVLTLAALCGTGTVTTLVRAGLPVLTLALVLGTASPARATLRTVTSVADSGAGSLRQAINASIAGDSIDFDPALNGQTITLTSGQLGIGRDLTINGPGWDKLTISGNDRLRIFQMASGHTVSISGLTLSHGKAQGGDGANKDYVCRYDSPIHQYPASIDPTPGEIGAGGAIDNAGTLNLSNCRIENCSAIGGKGGDSQHLNPDCNGLGIDETVFADAAPGGNGKGGAIYSIGILTISFCTFTGNMALGGQGGNQEDAAESFYPGNNGDAFGGAICKEGPLIDLNY